MRLDRQFPAFLAVSALAACNSPQANRDEVPAQQFTKAGPANDASMDDLETANTADAAPADYRDIRRRAPAARAEQPAYPARKDPGEWVPPKKDPPPKK